MQDGNNPESEGFFEQQYQKAERRKYNRIMRLARSQCPINYEKFARLLKYNYNINYVGTKNLTNRYVDDLISIGKLKKTDDGTVSLGDAYK
jgi:hypothetical protein